MQAVQAGTVMGHADESGLTSVQGSWYVPLTSATPDTLVESANPDTRPWKAEAQNDAPKVYGELDPDRPETSR